ncbi:hypothetical protein ACFXTH_046308 [Malus domestica]
MSLGMSIHCLLNLRFCTSIQSIAIASQFSPSIQCIATSGKISPNYFFSNVGFTRMLRTPKRCLTKILKGWFIVGSIIGSTTQIAPNAPNSYWQYSNNSSSFRYID